MSYYSINSVNIIKRIQAYKIGKVFEERTCKCPGVYEYVTITMINFICPSGKFGPGKVLELVKLKIKVEQDAALRCECLRHSRSTFQNRCLIFRLIC